MTDYNKAWFTEKCERMDRVKFLFFWGHQPSKNGIITQSYFSQWWVAPFEVEGIRYDTAEH